MNIMTHVRRLGVGALLAASLTAAAVATTSGNAMADVIIGQSPVAAKQVTVVGMVTTGVERCILLAATNGQTYQLLAVDPTTLPQTRPIRVTGFLRPDILTTCQQGITLFVTQVAPA